MRLQTLIIAKDEDAQRRRCMSALFYLEIGDLRQYVYGERVTVTLEFEISGYPASFLDDSFRPFVPCRKEIRCIKVENYSRVFYRVVLEFSTLDDQHSLIRNGLVSTIQFGISFHNSWVDMSHGLIGLIREPAYYFKLKLEDLMINDKRYVRDCSSSIVIHHAGTRYGLEWIDTADVRKIGAWSSKYAIVEAPNFNLEIQAQFRPTYRIDEGMALLLELVAGGIIGIIFSVAALSPTILAQWYPVILPVSAVLIAIPLLLFWSIRRYRLGKPDYDLRETQRKGEHTVAA